MSVNSLAQELANQIDSGKTDWKNYGGVHPKKYGNTMCATMIANALVKEWSPPLPADTEPRAYPTEETFDAKSYIHGRFLPFSDVKTERTGSRAFLNGRRKTKGGCGSGF